MMDTKEEAPLKVAPGQNAPQGVEMMHYKSRIDIESTVMHFE